jgi:hypothetical protein
VIVLDKGTQEDAELVKAGLNTILNYYGGNSIDDFISKPPDNLDNDLREALRLAINLFRDGVVYVTFRAKSALVPGMPKKVWSVERNVYQRGGARYYGYRVRLDEVVKNVLLGYRG